MPPRRRPSLPWIVAFALTLGMIGCGIFLGEVRQVMLNATNICLSCMGVG